MFLRLSLAIIVAFMITSLGHLYLYIRLIKPFVGYNHYWISIFCSLWGMTFLGFLILRIVPHFFRKIFEFVMFFWMGISYLFLIVCLLSSPVNLYLNFNELPQKNLALVVIAFSSALTILSMYFALKSPKILEVVIPIHKKIDTKIEQLKIIILSDIHISGLIGRRRMQNLATLVNSLNPDLIFITGDLMDGSVKKLKKEIWPLHQLKATFGIFYITGNHEYYSGPKSWKQFLEEKFKWNVLKNSAATLNIDNINLNILGIEDRHWLSYEKIPRKNDKRLELAVQNLESLRTHIPADELCILLAHQPKDSKEFIKYPFIDLQISGHTHGGQLWPLKYIVKKDQKYVKGLYQINDKQQIYVNQGTGFWGPPMRLGTQCEVTLMTFKLI